MKKNYSIILFIILISLILAGCNTQEVLGLYEYDTDKLEIGMTPQEVKNVWGEPDSFYQSSTYLTYTYENYDEYSGDYESYTLYFENNYLYEWDHYVSN